MEFMRRFGTLALAGLFILTSVAFTVVLFWSQGQDNANSDLTPEQQQMIQQQLNQTQNTEGNSNMLVGSQLADFTPITEPVTDIQQIDSVDGTGEAVPEGATITAHYTLAEASDGIVTESSHDRGAPLTQPLTNLIRGWQIGIPGMKVGGKRRLIVPAELAYQDGRTLVFDIELISFE